MAKNEMQELTEKTIASGGILAKLYFDMQSEKSDDLHPLMADLINNRLLKAPGVLYCFGAIDEVIKIDNEYSTNAIVTALFKDLNALINIAFNFTPAGVEIIKPSHTYELKLNDLQNIVLDIAQISVGYSDYILKRVLPPEEYEKIASNLKRRTELGKKLMEKKESDEEQKGPQD